MLRFLGRRNNMKKRNFAVVMSGGSIGAIAKSKQYKGKAIVKENMTKSEAMDLAKRRRKSLTPGERGYYRMSYSVVEIK